MPNRILRDGIITSERVNALSPEAEVFYRRLHSVVDDFGRYTGHVALLRAALYPLQLDRMQETTIKRHLAECVKARLINAYSIKGKQFVEVLDFRQQVRAKDSKYPQPPDRCSDDAEQMHSKCSDDAHLDGDGDGDGDDTSSSPFGDRVEVVQTAEKHREAFAAFWQLYPKRIGKLPAEKAWQKHGCTALLIQIMAALRQQKDSPDWRKDSGQFVPHPATWLNQHRWEDEPPHNGIAPVPFIP